MARASGSGNPRLVIETGPNVLQPNPGDDRDTVPAAHPVRRDFVAEPA
jgi:hypothetical protein